MEASKAVEGLEGRVDEISQALKKVQREKLNVDRVERFITELSE